MSTRKLLKLTALCAVFAASAAANAALVFDANVTNNVIMGSGIANGGFTVNTGGGVEIGLRARERYDLATDSPTSVTGSNGNGTYNQNAGEPAGFPTSNRARWNFDWSINTGTATVSSFTYRIGIDFDAGVGTNFLSFDLINGAPLFDHAFGNNATASGAGVVATTAAGYSTLKSTSSLVQNSWNMDFFDSLTFPFDPNANGNYSFFIEAIGAAGVVSRSDITVIVGAGAAVPEPGSLALIGLALVGLAATRRRA